MRQIFLASKKSQERPPLQRPMLANRPAQHRIARLERIEHCSLRGLPLDFEFHLSPNARQRSQMMRKQYSDRLHVLLLSLQDVIFILVIPLRALSL